MKKVIINYGGIIMFYLVIVGGVFIINYRFSNINNNLNKIAHLENE